MPDAKTEIKTRKLKPEDLDKIKQKMRPVIILRENNKRAKITVHMGTCGIASGAREVLKAFLSEAEEDNIDDVIITNSGCAGLGSKEPMATVQIKGSPPVKYIDLTPDKVKRIIKEHIMGGEIVTEYAFVIGSERVL